MEGGVSLNQVMPCGTRAYTNHLEGSKPEDLWTKMSQHRKMANNHHHQMKDLESILAIQLQPRCMTYTRVESFSELIDNDAAKQEFLGENDDGIC
jgi:hypothetical protein